MDENIHINIVYIININVKVKWSRYRPVSAQRVGRGIAVLFHDRGTRRRWVVSSTPRPHFTPGKDPVPIYRRLGGPQGRSGRAENLVPHRDSIPDRPARSQSLYRLSYPAHIYNLVSKFRRLRPHSTNGLTWTLDPEPFLPSSQRLKCSCKLEAHIISWGPFNTLGWHVTR